jgi:hypothetical protein
MSDGRRRVRAGRARLVSPAGAGAPGGPAATPALVTVIQRFGSGLQVNVHAHALVLDGVFTEPADGTLSPGAGSSGRRRDRDDSTA